MAAAALPVNADSRTVKTVAVTEPAAATADKTADEASDITNFFSSYLPDMSGTYGGSRPLSEADFDAARDEVWAAWCEAITLLTRKNSFLSPRLRRRRAERGTCLPTLSPTL